MPKKAPLVRKLESGRWQGRVPYYDPETGKRREVSQTFSTAKEADMWVQTQRKAFRESPERRSPRAETLETYLAEWWARTVDGRKSQGTAERYQYDIRHIVEHLGTKSLRTLTREDVYRLYSQLVETGLSSAAIENIHVVLRSALAQAVKWDLLSQNPTDEVQPPKSSAPKERAVLTRPQLQQLLAAADHHRLRGLWIVLAFTGIRKGEALGLQWPDVDWDHRIISIRRALKKNGADQYSGDPKSEASRRRIALSPYLLDALQKHQHVQAAERELAGERWSDRWNGGAWIFTTQTGRWLNPAHVHETFKRLLRHTDLPLTTRIHDLRHAMATHWIAQGVPVKVVSERLGHANIGITMEIYGHVLPDMQSAAAQEMDDWFLKESVAPSTDHPQKLVHATAPDEWSPIS